MADENQSMAEVFLAKLEDMAEDLGLEGDDREDMINSGMKRKGFVAKTMWADPEPDGKSGGGGDFFSRRQQENNGGNTRRVPGRGNSGSGQYGS